MKKKYEINDSFKYDLMIPAFYLLKQKAEDGYAFYHNGLYIIFSIEMKDDKRWLHVSFSKRNKMPEYEDILRIKKHFIGDDKKAIMIFPEEINYVNIMPYCLHLFSCLDDMGIPEFSSNGFL